MPWLIDGSNVLGAMRADRLSTESKRALARLLADFARARRTRVTCIFDGPEPAAFARQLGSVVVVFSGPRSADDLIVERAATGRGWNVVTSDAALAQKVQRRQVSVVSSHAFLRQLEEGGSGESSSSEDWETYFSDPKNRTEF